MAFRFCISRCKKSFAAACLFVCLIGNYCTVVAQDNDSYESDMVENIVSYIETEMARSKIKGLSLSIVHIRLCR
jgi:hypothetical protein